MRRVLTVLAILAVMAIAGGADKASAALATAEVEADYVAALAYWQVVAPPQCATVALEMAPTDPQGQGATARATVPRPGETEVACAITVDEDLWANESPCIRQMVLRHETGHLLGLSHSEDPASIMAPSINREVWCGEYPPAVTPAPEPATVDPAQAMRTMVLRELTAQRAHCRALRPHTGKATRCWRWARQLRSEYRSAA